MLTRSGSAVLPSLSVLVASCGRRSLSATLDSIAINLSPGDQLIVDVNHDGDYGNEARNRMMAVATGDYLIFMDDDDCYVRGAFDAIRSGIATAMGSVHMFRMSVPSWGRVLWTDEAVREGNVSTQMVAVPNEPAKLGRWSERYAADYDFIRSTCDLAGEPVWHVDVIALVQPAGPKSSMYGRPTLR